MIDIIVFIKKIKGERQIKLNNYRTLKKHSCPRKEFDGRNGESRL